MRVTAAAACLIALALLVPAASVALAQSPDASSDMGGANSSYEDGDFELAARTYQQIVDQGHREAALFFNLGNAHYKNGDIGRAVLNYLRAERLAPRDPDIRANLEIARGETVDVLDEDEGPGAAIVPTALRLTDDELAVVALALWVLTALSLALRMLLRTGKVRRAARYAIFIAGILMLVSAGSLGVRLFDGSDDDAVIIADWVDVLSGPDSQYSTEFRLHAGAEARLIDQRRDWARVALGDDEFQGWVPASDVERVSLP